MLDDKVCLVTGGGRRIGAEIVRGLHEAGASVAIHYLRSAADAETLATELNAKRKGSAATVAGDLRDTEHLPRIILSTEKQFGQLDVLVNNASGFYPTPLGTISDKHWQDLFGSNAKAPLFLAQAAAASLRETRGSIINMVDIHAQRPLRDHLVYGAAKAALAMLTKGLARELAPEVRVNGIAPGPILWPKQGLDETTQKKIVERTALKRAGTPADIVSCILYLVQDADYVTGQIIAVDGGRSIGW